MASKHLIPVILALFVWTGCSSPDEPSPNTDDPAITAFSNPDFRNIHDLKNQRQTKELLSFLQHENPSYRAEAAMAMGSVQDTSAIDALTKSLNDEAPEVRMMAAFALGQLRIPRAALPLVELVERDTTTEVRTEALEAIGKCGGKDAVAFMENYVPRYLFDESGQAWGIYQLALRGESTATHAAHMAELLASPYSESRLAACFYFYRYRESLPSEELELLVPIAVEDAADEVRMAAVRAMKYHRIAESTDALEMLVVRDMHPGVRVAAIESLMDTDSESARETIWRAVLDGNPNVALTAARYFVKNFEENDARRIHQQAVAHPSAPVRAALYRALMAHSESPELSAEIKQQFYTAPGSREKSALVMALGAAPENKAFIDSLINSEDPVIATAALQSLNNQYRIGLEESCTQLNALVHRILSRGDHGQLAVLGTMLQNEDSRFKGCLTDLDQILAKMRALPQPEALEAWIELNRAYAHLSGESPLALPEQIYRSIDWDVLWELPPNPTVRIHTQKGSVALVLLPQDAPATVSYFVKLLVDGYFDGKSFHRVVPNFVVQTGCSRGDGFGGSGDILRSEFSPLHYGPGVVGMASAGKDTESSQWFVTQRTTPHLDGRYTIFAAVVEGMDVVWQLEEGDKILGIEIIDDALSTP